jgi:hypothetical protein
MSSGLTQFGATVRESAYAVAQRARANAEQARAAADRMRAEAFRAVEPAVKVVETPAQIRAQVMAARGVDRLALLALNAQARIEAEISINAETAARARQAHIRTTGNFVDLKA